MAKLEFTKDEVEYIKSKAYFNEQELEILDEWLKDNLSFVQMCDKFKISSATLSKRKRNIRKKIKRVI